MMSWRYSTTALASLALFACQKPPEREPEPQPVSKPTPAVPLLPVAEPPMNREALLMAVIRAASAAAAGGDDTKDQRRLDGKRFELRLRFGCDGPDDNGDTPRGWTFDENRRVLQIHVESDISADTPLLSKLGTGQFEAAEGFWIRRPWLLTAACPAVTAAPSTPPPVTPSGELSPVPSAPFTELAQSSPAPRLAIVQFFTTSDSRTHRRDHRAYEVTRTLDGGGKPSNRGYDLIISGRLKRGNGGPVITCVSEDARIAPSCVISAEFERVALERPGTGEILADWAGR